MGKVLKVALCLPWYQGMDRDCSADTMTFMQYLGRIEERSWWLAKSKTTAEEAALLPKLDPFNTTGFSEFPAELIGTEIKFGIAEEVGCSLAGMARERVAEYALNWGADYLLWWDADMRFTTDAFFRLLLNRKPVCAALAFTGREPIKPVIYKFVDCTCTALRGKHVDIEVNEDYERDALQRTDAVGSGMFLLDANVLKRMEKPWFHSTGVGEDIYFCVRCSEHGIPVWVDTRVKTLHKATFAPWHHEIAYEESKRGAA